MRRKLDWQEEKARIHAAFVFLFSGRADPTQINMSFWRRSVPYQMGVAFALLLIIGATAIKSPVLYFIGAALGASSCLMLLKLVIETRND